MPQSVTAITAQSLERLQVNDFSDYVTRVPGLTADTSQPGSTRLTLRGLNAGGVASTIGTYVDETPFGSSSGLANGAVLAPDLDPFDVERIEVLRGPQGTLYGASTLGGLLKFVTRAPSPDELEFRVQATGESTEDGDESWGARALANVPLGSRAALRVSGWARSQGGFIDDPGRDAEDVNGVDTTGGRASFLVEATDDLSIRLSATIQDIESEAPNTANYFPEPLEPVAGDFDQFRGFPEKNDVTYDIYNGTIDWDLGWASLLSSTSYSELDQDNVQEGTAAVGLLSHLANGMTQEKFTQELRLASPATKHLEWLVGLFYTDEDASLFQQLFLSPPPGTPPPFVTIGLDSEYEEKAAFGTVTYYFTERFDVAAGVRYSENEQTAVQSSNLTTVGAQDADDSVTTYSLAPRWRVSDDTMLYARVATGYRPGGPNVLTAQGSTVVLPTYNSDEATNYELGIKTDLFDGELRLDAAVFFIDWEDIQLLVTDVVDEVPVSGNGNGGTAESQGRGMGGDLAAQRPSHHPVDRSLHRGGVDQRHRSGRRRPGRRSPALRAGVVHRYRHRLRMGGVHGRHRVRGRGLAFRRRAGHQLRSPGGAAQLRRDRPPCRGGLRAVLGGALRQECYRRICARVFRRISDYTADDARPAQWSGGRAAAAHDWARPEHALLIERGRGGRRPAHAVSSVPLALPPVKRRFAS